MPSIGGSIGILVEGELRKYIKRIKDEKVKNDIDKLLSLSQKMASSRNGILIAFFFSPFLIFPFIAAGKLLLMMAAIVASFIFFSVGLKEKKRIKKELEKLTSSDPEYWDSLIEKFNDMLIKARKKVWQDF